MFNASKEMKGSVFILGSAFMYATLPVLVKLAYSAGLGPSSTLLLRYVFSFLLLAFFLKFVKNDRVLTITPTVIAQGAFLTVSGLFYFLALNTLAAGLTTVIFFIHPVLVALLSILVFKERLSPPVFIGLALAVGGVALISGLVGGAPALDPKGMFFALLACICYSFYGLLGQKTVTQGNPFSLTASLSLIAVIIIVPVYHNSLGFLIALTSTQLLVTLLMAVFNTLLAVLLFLKGVQNIGAARATLISTAEPVFCLLMAYLILGETLSGLEVTGALMVFASMMLAVFSRHQPRG
ncbi:MAG: DMT family transporter [Syntrophomonadaceae bacterium]|nr:DMT family transporter [Syntrophomonadaceae bacterium]